MSKKLTDLAHLLLCQLHISMVDTSGRATVANHVAHILSVSGPAKIIQSAVRSVAIPMRDLMLGRWTRPDEGFAHKYMNQEVLEFASRRLSDAEQNGRVSKCIEPCAEDISGRHSDMSCLPLAPVGIGGSPDTAKAADLVIGPALDRAPFFGYALVSHVALLHRGTWSGAGAWLQSKLSPRYISAICAFLAITITASPSNGKPPSGASGRYHEWFESQIVPDGTGRSCCRESDGHILEDEDWRIAEGNYEVRIGEQWITFPNTGQGQPHNTVLGAVSNPTGHAVAWYLAVGSTVYPLCFAPGTVT